MFLRKNYKKLEINESNKKNLIDIVIFLIEKCPGKSLNG